MIDQDLFDPEKLSEFLDMGGPDLRDVLLAQVQADLARCRGVLAAARSVPDSERDLTALCKVAHEIKGLSATSGADILADIAGQAEIACSEQDGKALVDLLPMLDARIEETLSALAALAADR